MNNRRITLKLRHLNNRLIETTKYFFVGKTIPTGKINGDSTYFLKKVIRVETLYRKCKKILALKPKQL